MGWFSNFCSVLSARDEVLSNLVSNETSNRTSADNLLSQAISVISQQVSVLSQAHSVLSQRMSTLAGGAASTFLMKSGAADYDWKWVSAAAGGAASADVTSNKISILSQAVSVLSQQVSTLSQQLSERRTVQVRAVSVTDAVLGSTVASAISGLSVSCAANGIYEIRGLLMFSATAATGIAFLPTWTGTVRNAAGQMRSPTSVGAAGGSTFSTLNCLGFNDVVTGRLSGLWAAGGVHTLALEAILAMSTTGGTFALQAVTSATGVTITVLNGSFLRAYRIG